jgi:hypothetical protein
MLRVLRFRFVMLSEAGSSRSEVPAQSKHPYNHHGTRKFKI